MNDLLPLLGLGLSLVTALATFVLWLRRPGEDAAGLVRDLDTATRVQLAAQSARVDVLEERVKHMPTSDELTQLEGEMRAISAQLSAVADQLPSVKSALTRIENYLLSERNK